MTNKLKISGIVFLVSITLFTCKKDDDSTPPVEPPVDTMTVDTSMIDTLSFTGVQMTDFNGAPIGCYGGDCNDDWTNTTLTTEELEFLNFANNLPFDNLGTGTVNFITLYPNPIWNTGDAFLGIETTAPLKYKSAIVNNLGEVLQTSEINTNTGFNNYAIANSVFDEVIRKEVHRLYYAFYQQDGTLVFSGYGDFSICTQDNNPTLETCFE